MRSIISILLPLFLLGMTAEAQETKSSVPKVGRYIQSGKETKVSYSHSAIVNYQLTSVDVLNDKEMGINFIIANTKDKKCTIKRQYIKDNPFYIVDENFTKYKPLKELKADWDVYKKRGREYYVLAPTEKVKGYILFPALIKGARKFELFFGYDAQPIKDIQLIE